jgi:3-hydroxymyristoyl/3-hydroxydecanoyl-(acyl carrier protein) dehydratase
MEPSDNTAHVTVLRIAHDHPCLPGHFPGQPVVPGVLLLDSVLNAAAAWLGEPVAVTSLPQAKFIAPLLPGEDARIELQRVADELRFVIRRNDAVIAQGVLGLRSITDPS